MRHRSAWIKLAAATTMLALAAAPIWATEIQLRKDKDPRAKQEQAQPNDSPSEETKKKNCPTENSGFNTLEDLFGFLGTVDMLELQKQQEAEKKKMTAAEHSTGAQEVEWRLVEQPASDTDEQDQDKNDKKDKND